MKMIVTDKAPTFDSYNDNGYYENLVKSNIKHPSSKILGWWLMEEYFYYSCPIKNDPIFEGATPLILIDRTKQYCVYDTEFHGKYSEEKIKESISKYPYTILTLGCDDGNKGWLFESEEQALQWFKEFSETINTFSDKFSDGWEVLDYFNKNQVWQN